MADSDYRTLLDAAITHLEDLQARGDRFVQVDRGLLRDLVTSPAPVATPSSARSAPTAAAVAAPAVQPPAAARPAVAVRAPAPVAAPAVQVSAPPAAPVVEGGKAAAFEELRSRVVACVRCPHLASSRKNVVFGVGNIDSPLMFVGEAPGADEDVQAEPFVGAAGQLLTKIIQTMGLSRQEVYIGNVLKCRPDTPGQRAGNRKPTPEEMATCLPYLKEQIRIIQPKVIVALGATAMEGLFGRSPVYITKIRGQWQDLDGIAVMPTYHPSYVLRNQSLATKRETWTDMLAAMERLGMPISDRQRGFFLPAS